MPKNFYRTSDFDKAVALIVLGYPYTITEKEAGRITFIFEMSSQDAEEQVRDVFFSKRQAPIIDVLNTTRQLKSFIHG